MYFRRAVDSVMEDDNGAYVEQIYACAEPGHGYILTSCPSTGVAWLDEVHTLDVDPVLSLFDQGLPESPFPDTYWTIKGH